MVDWAIGRRKCCRGASGQGVVFHPVMIGLLVLSLLLGGCDSPSPGRFDRTARLEVEGDRFAVHWSREDDGGAAQALRLNKRWGAKLAVVRGRAIQAIEKASGCRVDRRSVEGDANVIRAAIICR